MTWKITVVMACVAVLAAIWFPSAASAQIDPQDSITINAPVAGTGAGHPIYASYPFSISGDLTVEGNLDGYSEYVVYTPSTWRILTPSCSPDYAEVVQEIDIKGGGRLAIYSYEEEGVSPVLTAAGSYTYTAYVNGDTIPTLTNPGGYVACAYLFDSLSNDGPLAVSPTPIAFSVGEPAGSATPPGGFGGPPAHPGHASDLTLRVAPARPPIRAPGNNVIEISGRSDPSSGPAFITVTLKNTSSYNGCASNDQADTQITEADRGVMLAFDEQVTPSEAGVFEAPIALTYKRAARGSGVICAYLQQYFSDVAVGYERFSLPAATPKKRSSKHKAKPKRG